MRNYDLVEKAIIFLARKFETTQEQTKPVLLHSLRVGIELQAYEEDDTVVIAGLFHDLLEDTDTTFAEIEQKFGIEVAELVKVNSYDNTIEDKEERYKDLINRCIKNGRESVIIKLVDNADNLNYYRKEKIESAIRNMESRSKYLLEKIKESYNQENAYKKLNELVIN